MAEQRIDMIFYPDGKRVDIETSSFVGRACTKWRDVFQKALGFVVKDTKSKKEMHVGVDVGIRK